MSREDIDNRESLSKTAVEEDRDITDVIEARGISRESEDKYRLIVENASQGIVVAQESAMRYVNPKITEYSGYTREELTSRPFIELIHPDDREMVMRQHHDILLGKAPSGRLSHRIIHKEGRIRWIEVTGVPFTWDGTASTLLFISDITERKETEDKLRQSEERYRDLIEDTGDLIYVIDGGGNFKLVNQTIERKYGYTASELLGKGFTDIITPESYKSAIDDFKKQLQGIEVGNFEYDLYDKNGEIKTIETSERLVWEGDQVVEVHGIARDVTDRKRAEAALRESEEKYRLVVENAEEVIIVAVDGYLELFNRKTLELYGYSQEELKSTPIIEFFHPDDRDLVLEYRTKRENDGAQPQSFTARMVTKSGKTVWMENSVVPFLWRGKRAALVIASDISERKRIEDALRESEEKYRLVVENAGEGIAIAQDGVTRFVNPIITRLLGYSAEELTSRPFIEFLHPDDRQVALDHHTKRTAMHEKPAVYLFRAVGKTGDIIWFENNAVLITWEGKPATLNFLRDITEQRKIEEVLKESEEKYRLVVENANEIIIITQDGFVKFSNRGLINLFGITPETLVGRHLSELVIEEDRDKILEEHRKLVSGEEILSSYRYRVRDGGGNVRFVEVNGITITWEGQPCVLSFVSDITEKVRAEEEIKRRLRHEQAVAFCSRELVHSPNIDVVIQTIVEYLLETMRVSGVFICKNIVDPVEGLSMVTISEAMSKGYRPPIDFTAPNKVPYKYRSKEMLDELRSGHPFGGLTKDYPPIDREILSFIGSLSSIMIPIFVGGTFWGFIAFDDHETERIWDQQDILLLQTISSMIGTAVARKEAETALTESEQRYRELVDSTSDIIYVIDYKGNFKFVNNAVRQLGYEPDETVGRNIYEFYAPSSKKYAQELFRLQRTGAQLRGYELDIIRKDGQVRTIEFRDDLKWEGDRIVEIQGIGRDVTDRKRREDRLRLVAGSQEAVLNSLPDMVFFADLTLKITWVNRAATRLSGFSIEELVGRFCYEVLHQKKAPCEGCPAVASLATAAIEKNDSMPCFGKNRMITAYPVPDISGNITGMAVSIGDIKSGHFLDITEGLSQLDDEIEDDRASELFLAPLDPNYIYPFSVSIDLQKDTFVITLRWDEYRKEHLLKRLARSESAVARFIYLAARMKADGTGWVDKDLIRAGTMDTNLNKLRSLLEESNVPFLDRFSSRMLIRSNKEEKKKVRLALSPSNIEISPNISIFRSKKHQYLTTVSRKIKRLEREIGNSDQPKEYLMSELTIQHQNEANLKKSIEVVETLIGESTTLLGF